MLLRVCSHIVRGYLQSAVLSKKCYSYLKIGNINAYHTSIPLLSNDPCEASDVYKISPLCPPRGYEFKKSSCTSLKCPKKTPCKVEKKEQALDPTKAAEGKGSTNKEVKKNISEIKKEDKQKKGFFSFPKREEKKDAVNTKEKPKKEENEVSANSKNGDKKDCTKIEGHKDTNKDKKDRSKNEDKKPNPKEASKKPENPKCADPPELIDCGKPKEKCIAEKRKSVIPPIVPKKDKTRPAVSPECPPKKCKPAGNPACDIKRSNAKTVSSDKEVTASSDKDECHCSTMPWPFNLFGKSKKKLDKKKKCTTDKKKMVASSHEYLYQFKSNNLIYPCRNFIESGRPRYIHSCPHFQTTQPVCPTIPCPVCTGKTKLSEEMESFMVVLRATARANRKRLPESCVSSKEIKPCLTPTEGWEPTQIFSLMRNPEVIKKTGLRVIESPRLVTRKLRKR